MQRLIYILFTVFLSANLCAQQDNPFMASENEMNAEYESGKDTEPEVAYNDPGNPADPVPIDDYLPLLAAAGVAIAGYSVYRRRLQEKA